MNKDVEADFYFSDEKYNSSAAGSTETMVHFGKVKVKNTEVNFIAFNSDLMLTKTPPGIMHNKFTFDVTRQNPDFSNEFNKYNYDKDDVFSGRFVFPDKSELKFQFTFTGEMIENQQTSYQGRELQIITFGDFIYSTQP